MKTLRIGVDSYGLEPLQLTPLTIHEFSSLIQLSQYTEEAFRTDRLDITDGEHWPRVCEARLKRDIDTLKELLRSNPNH